MLSLIGLCLLLLAGHGLRTRVRLLQRLYLPSCVIGGLAGLLALQAAKGAGAPVPAEWTAGWRELPGFLINIVFACLFLGVKLPRLSRLWGHAGPQVAYGQIVAWGQYAVGVGLALAVLIPAFDLRAVLGGEAAANMFAGVLEVGFEGGHGTAAGLAETFRQHGWANGLDFALASATLGMVSAILVGMALVNWATRRGYTARRLSPAEVPEDDTIGIIPVDVRPEAGRLSVRSDSIEAFSLHLSLVAVAVLLGWLAKQGLLAVQGLVAPGIQQGVFTSFPLFPLCMLGGLAVQVWEEKFDRHQLIDLGLVRRIQNAALDFLVVAAVATIRLDVVTRGLVPLLILAAAGVAWNVFCLAWLARRLLPDAWFERAIAELGQSMGVTATGLMLLRVVDPSYETPAADAFAYKQLIHEPFMGGGLWTSMAIPLLAIHGGPLVLLIALGAIAAWALVALASGWLRRPAAASY